MTKNIQYPTRKSNTESSNFWNDVLTSLKGSMQEATYNHHFLGSTAAIDDDGALTILLPPTANIDAIMRGYDRDIHRLVARTIGERPIRYQEYHPNPPLPQPTPAALRDMDGEFALRMAQDTAADDVVSYRRIHVVMCEGNVNAAIILSHLAWWHQPGRNGQRKMKVFRDGEYWIARTRDELQEFTGLKPRQSERAINYLTDSGLVIKTFYRFNGMRTMHLRIEPSTYLDRENEAMGRQ